MTRPRTSKAATLRQLRRILLVAIMLLSGGWSLARATEIFHIDWLDMSTEIMNNQTVLVGGTVSSGDVFYLPGFNVKITYTNPLPTAPPNWRHRRSQYGDAQDGAFINSSGDLYSWTTFDALSQTNEDVIDSDPVTYNVKYKFFWMGPVPAGELVLGVFGLGRQDTLNEPGLQYISTIIVANLGEFLGDFDLPYNPPRDFGPTLFVLNPPPPAPPPPSFLLQNSVIQTGTPVLGAPWFNTDLGLVRIDEDVTDLTLDVTHIGQDGFGFSVGRKYDASDSCPDVWITPNLPWDCPDIWLNKIPIAGQTVTITANIHNTGPGGAFADIKFEWGFLGSFHYPEYWNLIGTNPAVWIPKYGTKTTSIDWPIPSAAVGHSCIRVTIVQPTYPIECNITPENYAWENLWVLKCKSGKVTESTGPIINADDIPRDILIEFSKISTPAGWDAWISDSLLEQVGPGETQDVTVYFSVPSTAVPGDSALANFELYLLPEGDHIGGTDIKAIVVPEEQIPTLTEWGMIIFCVLLFGWMAWVIVRRRRRVTAGI